MRRGGLGFGGLALALLLATAASSEDAVVELDESADEECVAGCEARHEDCVRAAQSTRSECEAKRRACDDTCAPCLHLQGPPVVYCVQECENCRAELKRLPCAPTTDARAACGRTRDACLRDCR
jgi:hypothetical protein